MLNPLLLFLENSPIDHIHMVHFSKIFSIIQCVKWFLNGKSCTFFKKFLLNFNLFLEPYKWSKICGFRVIQLYLKIFAISPLISVIFGMVKITDTIFSVRIN